ncbi:hypothetical protein D9M68_1002870 [compost metagenome]
MVKPMTMAVRISACGSGLAMGPSGCSSPGGTMGAISRVSRPAVKISRFTPLPRMVMPSSMRITDRDSSR